jgi:hypothetical protein
VEGAAPLRRRAAGAPPLCPAVGRLGAWSGGLQPTLSSPAQRLVAGARRIHAPPGPALARTPPRAPAPTQCPLTQALACVERLEPDPYVAAILAALGAAGGAAAAAVTEVELRPADASWRPRGCRGGAWFDVLAPPAPAAVLAAAEEAAAAAARPGAGGGGGQGPAKRRRGGGGGADCVVDLTTEGAGGGRGVDVIVID